MPRSAVGPSSTVNEAGVVAFTLNETTSPAATWRAVALSARGGKRTLLRRKSQHDSGPLSEIMEYLEFNSYAVYSTLALRRLNRNAEKPGGQLADNFEPLPVVSIRFQRKPLYIKPNTRRSFVSCGLLR